MPITPDQGYEADIFVRAVKGLLDKRLRVVLNPEISDSIVDVEVVDICRLSWLIQVSVKPSTVANFYHQVGITRLNASGPPMVMFDIGLLEKIDLAQRDDGVWVLTFAAPCKQCFT